MEMQPQSEHMASESQPQAQAEGGHVEATQAQAQGYAQGQEAQKHMDQPMDVDDSMNTTITASTVGPLPSFNANNGYAANNSGYSNPPNNSGYPPNNSGYPPNNGGYPANNAGYPNNNGYAANNVGYAGSPDPYAQPNNNTYAQEQHRPSTSYSDTAYQYSAHNGSRFNTPSDADTPPRQTSYNDGSRDTHMGQSQSRPNSQMGRYPGSDSGSRSNSYQDQNRAQQQQQQPQPEAPSKNASVVIKVGMVGDAQIGKTSLMVKYVEGSWDEDYIQTLGM
jgi:GTP-binding protein of the ras superfamily involved in termination of M-phase